MFTSLFFPGKCWSNLHNCRTSIIQWQEAIVCNKNHPGKNNLFSSLITFTHSVYIEAHCMENKITHGFIPGINGLRAIAVIAVIFFHMDITPLLKGGFTGVDLFFVISGYVISRSLYKSSFTGVGGYLSHFYKRRILRIAPAVLVSLLCTIIVTNLFIPSAWLSSTINKTGLSSFFGYSNFSLVWYNDGYFSPRVDFNPFLHTWSLAVEEQFYLIFPIIFYIWLKFRKKKSPAGYFSYLPILLLSIASLVFAFFETQHNLKSAYYLLPARFWELAAGVLLFQLHVHNVMVPTSKNVSRFFLILGFMLILIGFIFTDQRAFPFPWALVPVSGAVFLISSVVNSPGGVSFFHRFLNSRLLGYIGTISYSLYLWHWPVSALLRWTIGFNTIVSKPIYLFATCILAVISYTWVENPVRNNRFLSNQKNWKIIASGCACILITFFIAQFIVASQQTISLSVTKDTYTWYVRRYGVDGPDQPVVTDPAVTGRRIFVAGDSHTAAYRTMLTIVSKELGVEIYEYEAGGCAVGGLLKPLGELGHCESFYNHTIGEIKKLAQPGDILFLASLRMPEFSDQFEVVDSHEVLAEFNSRDAVENRIAALEEASELIEEFAALGVLVLIDAPKPVLQAPPYRCSDWFNAMNPICSPGLEISREFLLEVRQPVMESLGILRERHKNLFVWDPFFVLCEDEMCSGYDDNGKPFFFDGDHLSAHGNRVLAPSFREKILSIWLQD
jgi:peptidoglycan/LPS O-acetylase OafA/YrhL